MTLSPIIPIPFEIKEQIATFFPSNLQEQIEEILRKRALNSQNSSVRLTDFKELLAIIAIEMRLNTNS